MLQEPSQASSYFQRKGARTPILTSTSLAWTPDYTGALAESKRAKFQTNSTVG